MYLKLSDYILVWFQLMDLNDTTFVFRGALFAIVGGHLIIALLVEVGIRSKITGEMVASV